MSKDEQQQDNADTGDQAQQELSHDDKFAQVETHAREMGWVPKEEWRGNPDTWRDASEFVKRGEEILPIVRSTNKKLESENRNLKTELEEVKKTAEEFKQFMSKTEERAYKKAMETLKAERKDAIAKGDGERFEQAEEAIKELETPKKKTETRTENTNTEPSPEFKAWMDKNSWYGGNKRATAMANAIAEEIAATKPHLKGKPEFLEEVTRLTKEELPHLFESERRNGHSRVEGGGTSGNSGRGKKGAANLTAEARAQGERFVKNGYFKSLDDYAKSLAEDGSTEYFN